MEYLMTYGWAILIIAVVLGALFQLGVFNGATFAPKAPPGACQVFRPNGPGTAFDLNIEGVCNGELPQFVGFFNGTSSYVNSGSSSNLDLGASGGSGTISVWFQTTKTTRESLVGRINPSDPWQGYILAISDNSGTQKMAFWSSNGISGYWNDASSIIVTNGNWHDGVVTFSGSSATFYVDGKQDGTVGIAPVGSYATTLEIGVSNNQGDFFSGSIANVQIYNSSLTEPEINALYDEGIGGAPIDLQNLVGWWPLNGNANDYSGNENNGVPSNVVFTSSWTSGYTTP